MLYEQLFIVPLVKQNIIVFAANNSRCCKCLVAPTIIWSGIVGLNGKFFATQNHKKNARKYPFVNIGSTY